MEKSIEKQMEELYLEIESKKKKFKELRDSMPKFEVADVEFQNLKGPLKLSELFGDSDELILVYNMGSKCPYCALWADEYNGVYHHLKSRVPFVVSSPDTPQHQAKISEERSYKFPMVQSTKDFRVEMGFEKEGALWPGYSIFQKTKDGKIEHVSKDFFGPGDNYCGVWHFFENLPNQKEWHPSLSK